MLTLRQMIPPLTMRALHATPQAVGAPLPEGRIVRAWDYKQKRALVIAFLHHDCGDCCEWLAALRLAAAKLDEKDAAALVVFSSAPDVRLCENVPANMALGVDVNGHSVAAFLGKQALDRVGQRAVGVFVTDRYGELFAQWIAEVPAATTGRSKDRPLHGLPSLDEVLSCLTQIQMVC